MATSTTTAYNLTAQRLIDLALMDVGVAGQDGSVDPSLRAQALDLLNIFVKRLDVDGDFLWHIQRRIQTLTAGQANYTLLNDVYDIDEPARYTQAGATIGSQMTPMARDEYMIVGDRTLQGTPFRYYAEKSLDATGIEQITVYLYPTPPNTGDTMEYAAVLRSHDITDLSQTLDIPQKWLSTVRWGLAASLGPSYSAPIERIAFCQKQYEVDRDKAIGDDNERGSVQLVPFGQSYGYGAWSSNGGYR